MVEVSSTIQCKTRAGRGKEAAHKLRATGQIPAVAYGPGTQPRHLSLDPHIFGLQRKQYGRSFIYDVEIEGEKGFKALIKDLQVDPLERVVIHVDLYAVDMTKPIRIEVPIELVGKPAGAIEGGLLSQVMRVVEVLCLPDKVPSSLSLDVTHLNIGQSVHSDSIDLPDGIELTLRRPEAVATVVAPMEEEVVAVEEDLEGVEGVEGDAAAEGEGEGDAAAPAEGEAADKKDKDDKKKDK